MEIVTETKSAEKMTKLIYSGTHSIRDIAVDVQQRLFFFDGSYGLKMIRFNSEKSEDICSGELWGKCHLTTRQW